MLRGRARRARQRARDPGTIRGGARVRVHQYGAERGMIDGASFGRPSHRGAVRVVALVAQNFTRDGTCLRSAAPRVKTRVQPGRARRRGVVRFARAVVDLGDRDTPHRAHAGRIRPDPARARGLTAHRRSGSRQPATSGEPSRRPLARFTSTGAHPVFNALRTSSYALLADASMAYYQPTRACRVRRCRLRRWRSTTRARHLRVVRGRCRAPR